jgi:hypothetical protein
MSLFLVINLLLVLATVTKFPEGVVVGLLTHTNIRNQIKKKLGDPHTPLTMLYLSRQMGVFSKVVLGFQNFGYDF